MQRAAFAQAISTGALELMLASLIRNIARPRKAAPAVAEPALSGPLRLHIGGKVQHPEWKVMDVIPGPHVDFIGHCTDLSRFADSTVTEIYASHVLEHLGYQTDLPAALREFHRVLIPGAELRISVPDISVLCALFLDPALSPNQRFQVMRMMFGGQSDEADFHYVGLNEEFLITFMHNAGFVDMVRVENFGYFQDTSCLVFSDRLISLNVFARKPAATTA